MQQLYLLTHHSPFLPPGLRLTICPEEIPRIDEHRTSTALSLQTQHRDGLPCKGFLNPATPERFDHFLPWVTTVPCYRTWHMI